MVLEHVQNQNYPLLLLNTLYFCYTLKCKVLLFCFLYQGYRTYLRAHTLSVFSRVSYTESVILYGICLSFRFSGQPDPSILLSLYHSPYSNLLVTSEYGHACLLCRLWTFEFMFLSLCSKYPHPLNNIFSAKIWNFSRMFGQQYYPDTEFMRSNLG